MSKIYERTENGTTTPVDRVTGLAEINAAMMGVGRKAVRSMSSITRTDYAIDYRDGRSVRLILVDTPEEPTAEEPEADEHCTPVMGGKVHTLMPGAPADHAYPLCRGGGMNQRLTKFRIIKAPLTCSMCLTYAERRKAASANQ